MVSVRLARTAWFLPLSSSFAFHTSRTLATQRLLSSASSDVGFGGDVSEIYASLFEDNKPIWLEILATAKELMPTEEGKILDIATGPGEPAATLGAALPNVKVIATDLEEAMIEKAAQRTAQLANVECRVMSAEDLSAFGDAEFDLMTVCFGHMFIPDLDKALKEAHRVLKPDGHMISVVWKRIGHFDIASEVLAAVDPAAEIDYNPASLSEEGLMESKLSSAGFDTMKRTEGGFPFAQPDLKSGFIGFTLPVKTTLDGIAAERPEAQDVAYKTFLSIIERDGYKLADDSVVTGADVNRYIAFVAKKTA